MHTGLLLRSLYRRPSHFEAPDRRVHQTRPQSVLAPCDNGFSLAIFVLQPLGTLVLLMAPSLARTSVSQATQSHVVPMEANSVSLYFPAFSQTHTDATIALGYWICCARRRRLPQ